MAVTAVLTVSRAMITRACRWFRPRHSAGSNMPDSAAAPGARATV